MAEIHNGIAPRSIRGHATVESRPFAYEHHRHRLISRREFARRVAHHFLITFAAILAALLLGILGYHFIGRLSWMDALLNAAMLLGGMGPVNHLDSPAAKLFASAYALFAGLLFVGLAALLAAPFLHRFLHRFHLDDEEERRRSPHGGA